MEVQAWRDRLESANKELKEAKRVPPPTDNKKNVLSAERVEISFLKEENEEMGKTIME